MGDGVAAILTALLQETMPSIHCIAYSAPGGLVTLDLAQHFESCVLSVTLGNDIVARLPPRHVLNLKIDVLKT